MSVSRFSPGENTWSNLPERWRAQLINSASGFKPLVLLATRNSQDIDNLSVFSQLIHLGANPPLLGVLFRPDSVPRHTLENLQTQGMATVNAVRYEDRRAAHQTSARYPADVSEFDAVGLKREFRPEWPVPFVHGCPVQWAVRLQTLLPISANGTQLAVLEVPRRNPRLLCQRRHARTGCHGLPEQPTAAERSIFFLPQPTPSVGRGRVFYGTPLTGLRSSLQLGKLGLYRGGGTQPGKPSTVQHRASSRILRFRRNLPQHVELSLTKKFI